VLFLWWLVCFVDVFSIIVSGIYVNIVRDNLLL